MIPPLDLKSQYATNKSEIDSAIRAVLDSSQFIGGDVVESFEREFAEYCGTKYAIGVGSGTAALHISLWAAGVGPGDEVITTPLTFISTVETIVRTGATPVLVDVDPQTLNIDIDAVERAITERTKAIIPVHLFGLAVDMARLQGIADARGIAVIEDAAQAHGATYYGTRVGGAGVTGCFSFYPTKNLGAYGDGGAITTNSEEIYEKTRQMRDHGRTDRFTYGFFGQCERLDAIQAAVLSVKLRKLDKWNAARIERAELYEKLLGDLPISLPQRPDGFQHVFHLYVIQTDHRDQIQEQFRTAEISSGVQYPIPVHLQPAMGGMGYSSGDLPASELASTRMLSLPLFPELPLESVERVADEVRSAVLR
jgi:dTDP-4-amino-4,6-dideoxygalactose transaminase